MTTETKMSSQGRTVIPVEIRKKLEINEGEEVEWDLQGEVIIVKPVREEKTPDEIMGCLKDTSISERKTITHQEKNSLIPLQ